MASSRRERPPSYEETMERLGRSHEHGDSFSGDQQSPDHIYHTRIYNDQLPSPDHNSGRADGDRRLEQGVNQANETVSAPTNMNTTEPATISHTLVQPQIVQPGTVHLPLDVNDQPARPTSLSPSTGGSTLKPKQHYTKKRDSKRSGSRSPGDPGLSPMAVDIAGNREEEWHITRNLSTRSQTSDDYWQTSPGTASPTSDEPIMRPMQVYIGTDGKKYLRDTSIEVVEHKVPRKRNLEKNFAKPTLPDNFEWFSILGMICFLPIGAYAFKRSRDVQKMFDKEDFGGAEAASSSARTWATAAFMTGSVIIIVFLFVLFVEPCPIARALMADNICLRGT